MLEDELTSILADDDDVKQQLVIVDSTEQQELARKLRSQNRPFITVDFEGVSNLVTKHRRRARSGGYSMKERGALRQVLRQQSADALVVVVHVLTLGLHVDGVLLMQEVYRQIERLAAFSDGIFVLYGVFDALRTLEHDFNDSVCPLFFLADDDGAKVEDCIALALGGNEEYANVLTNDKDIALFLTPMWAAHWQDLHEGFTLMKHVRFKKVAKVDTALSYEPDFDANVNECAKQFNLHPVPLKGDTTVVHRSYLRAKSGVYENTAPVNRIIVKTEQLPPSRLHSTWRRCSESLRASVPSAIPFKPFSRQDYIVKCSIRRKKISVSKNAFRYEGISQAHLAEKPCKPLKCLISSKSSTISPP